MPGGVKKCIGKHEESKCSSLATYEALTFITLNTYWIDADPVQVAEGSVMHADSEVYTPLV